MVLPDNIKTILGKLGPDARERILANPELLDVELRSREKYYPSKNFVPNRGQARFNEFFRKPNNDYGDYPKEAHFIAGNGSGKTCDMAIFLAGCTLGNEFLNPHFFKHEFFDECKKIRRKRPLRVRVVCEAADVKENSGSVYQQIKQWLPVATWHGKTSDQYYTMIHIPAPDPGYHATKVDVKTHKMSPTAQAGPDFDLVIFNEPAPKNIYSENASRTRKGGRIVGFMTPLNMAPYLHKVIQNNTTKGRVVTSGATIWDNCKDIPGTNGILTRADVEDQIRRWQALGPIEAEAREKGLFMHLAGAVFKSFNKDVHIIPPRPIQDNWRVYMCVDPHPHKPPVAIWVAQDPANFLYVIAEYPNSPWDITTQTRLTIKHFCHDFREIEAGRNPHFPYMKNVTVCERFGDPNAMKAEQPHNRRTIKQEYEWTGGFTFNTNIDNDIELRHDKIKDLLLFDHKRPIDAINTSHLFIYDSCINMSASFENYAYKKKQGDGEGLSDKLEEDFKCFIDALGYIVVSIDSWSPFTSNFDDGGDEWDAIEQSRDPFRYNEISFGKDNYTGAERFV